MYMFTKIYKTKNVRPKFKIRDLIGAADSKKTFSKGDSANWSYKFYEITKFINDTISSYRFDDLPERYNEAFSKKLS